MKKYIFLILSLVLVLSLGACKGTGEEDESQIMETANTYIDFQNDNVSIALTEDTAKTLLGVFTPEQLHLKKSIDEYELKLSKAKYNGEDGCKVEAFADGELPEGTFMIVGKDAYVYNQKKKKYVLLSADNSKTSTKTTTEKTDDTTKEEIPDDPEITFQYHKGNNQLMRKRFAKYDIAQLGLSKEVSEYVFIVNGNSGFALDGQKIYYVDVYEKNGEETGVRLGFSEDAEYVHNPELVIYEKLEKQS